MPVRHVDLLQDRWAAQGRYSRTLDPRTQALVDEMFPPPLVQRVRRTPGGHSDRYLDDMAQRILEALGDDACTRHELADRVGVSSKYIAKALTAAVADGRLVRDEPAGRATVRYWRPRAAEAA